MAASTFNVFPSSTRVELSFPHSKLKQQQARFSSFSLRIQPIICGASNSNKSHTVQPIKHSPSSSNRNRNHNNKNKKKNNVDNNKTDAGAVGDSNSPLPHIPTPLPKPPAGFVVDDSGKLLTSSRDRLATLVSFVSCCVFFFKVLNCICGYIAILEPWFFFW